ncbi:MAG: 30S ribosomal protein S2 [Candidatus Bathyarchaeota archaeon]|uniref:30S ribosomal protein S2 n=1 Tax=Candidatus Bathycorpusculum sp. TaxID=2994959 RepID=UPI00282383EB|nr:30S ribosomal protein S2 [Candidatus Termiticorpusculum sp.]MCL2257830.1 30S ribosomal protein S2 [Candidatus Termiticorpusculum sp.]MCL2292037.1 30S ribosomal protein S2 [Candidatus Termiticorpusculum sp.]
MAEDQVKENQLYENQPETEEEALAANKTIEETVAEEPNENEEEATVEEPQLVDETVTEEDFTEENAEDFVEEEETEKIDLPTDEEFVEETEDDDEKQDGQHVEELLLPRDTLLSAGIHIGTRMKTLDMAPFIYRVRPDGLFVLDVKKADDRIRTAAKFLARYEKAKVAVAATRLYAHEPVKKFCEITGSTPIIGRFIPGQLSNPQYSRRVDPEIIVVSDPRADGQAVKEASKVGIPIVALCSTDNEFAGVDLVIPTNNKGRRALAVIFWLLARQILRERGELGADKEPSFTIEDFEAKVTREEEDT